MKKILVILIVGLIGIAILLYLYTHLFSKKVHFHAGFQVYVDDHLQNFSDVKYMDLQPCTANTQNQNEQLAKAHLHEGIGDVVHVHRTGATWQDLFKNIGFSLNTAEPVEGYVNGKKVAGILSQQIHPYDILILFIGTHGPLANYTSHAVTKAHIQMIEKTSELCGS